MGVPSHPKSDIALPKSLDAAFWPVLILAGALFAVASLSPGAAEWKAVRHRLAVADANAAALRSEIDGLNRVATALRSDPAFAAEVARLDLGLARGGADRLSVPAAPPPVALAPPPTPPVERWPLIDAVAARRGLRVTLAAVAATLAAVAFTLCQPAAADLVRHACGRRGRWAEPCCGGIGLSEAAFSRSPPRGRRGSCCPSTAARRCAAINSPPSPAARWRRRPTAPNPRPPPCSPATP